MNVYVETNFILELAFLQEDHESCEGIMRLCESGRAALAVPAFCLAESYGTGVRRAQARTKTITRLLDEGLGHLLRSQPYQDTVNDLMAGIAGVAARSFTEEDQRLAAVVQRVSRVARSIPLDAGIVLTSIQFRSTRLAQRPEEREDETDLEPADLMVYYSVLHDLSSGSGVGGRFITRDKHFLGKDIVETLAHQDCKVLSFIKGFEYVRGLSNAADGK
jgi:hypothetical protein